MNEHTDSFVRDKYSGGPGDQTMHRSVPWHAGMYGLGDTRAGHQTQGQGSGAGERNRREADDVDDVNYYVWCEQDLEPDLW